MIRQIGILYGKAGGSGDLHGVTIPPYCMDPPHAAALRVRGKTRAAGRQIMVRSADTASGTTFTQTRVPHRVKATYPEASI